MARSRRRGRASGNTGTVVAAVALFAVSAALLAGLGYLYYSASRQTLLDKETLCPVTGPVAVTAVLFDTTDPISATTRSDLINRFRQTVSEVPVGGLVEISELTETPGEISVIFEGCNPGDGSTVDQWTNNPARRQKQWEDAFDKPLDDVPGEIGSGTSASQSPIMAAIQKIKLTLFDRLAVDAPKNLIVVSDMIEHTNLYSQYKDGLDYDKYLKTDASREYRTALDGVGLTILYVERAKLPFDSRDHAEFWARWIQSNGGNLQRVVRLEGLN
jgi:hypothetical protein